MKHAPLALVAVITITLLAASGAGRQSTTLGHEPAYLMLVTHHPPHAQYEIRAASTVSFHALTAPRDNGAMLYCEQGDLAFHGSGAPVVTYPYRVYECPGPRAAALCVAAYEAQGAAAEHLYDASGECIGRLVLKNN